MTTFTKAVGGTSVDFDVDFDKKTVTATPQDGATVTFDHAGRAKFPVAEGEASSAAKFAGTKLFVTFGSVGYNDKFTVDQNEAAIAA